MSLNLGERRIDVDRVLLATGFPSRPPGERWPDDAVEVHGSSCADCGYPDPRSRLTTGVIIPMSYCFGDSDGRVVITGAFYDVAAVSFDMLVVLARSGIIAFDIKKGTKETLDRRARTKRVCPASIDTPLRPFSSGCAK